MKSNIMHEYQKFVNKSFLVLFRSRNYLFRYFIVLS